jgi:uncharacterized membrane protein
MKLKLTIMIAAALVLFFFSQPARAQEPDNISGEPVDGAVSVPVDEFSRAEVIQIVNEERLGSGDDKQLFQDLKVKILSGSEKGQEATITNIGGTNINGGRGFKIGDTIVISKTMINGEPAYYVEDSYRLPKVLAAVLVFLLVVLAFSRWRGVLSLLGLAISIAVIVKYVAPQILAGHSPLAVGLAAAAAIALASLYLAHGFNRRTTIALISTFITLGISVGVAVLFVTMTRLFGYGSEESVYLQFGATGHIDLQGLLLAGIILGSLGVLDDITTAQSATVDELKKANPAFSFKELYRSASSVGREHISSLINTLFLAYAGVSLPLFLLFQTNASQPIWTIINSEFIAEEIIRTLVGSITLIVAVPITTALASYYFSKKGASREPAGQLHIH